jgi:hypothetical protein
LVQPIAANATFSHTIFVDDLQAHGLVEVQAKVLMASSKLKIRHSRACLSPHHSMVDFCITLAMEEFLI